jgi:hypothetical protein
MDKTESQKKPAPTPKKRAKFNWVEIRSEYVEAPSEDARPTLEQLAKKHGVSPAYLRERASKEDWVAEADKYLRTIAKKRLVRKARKIAETQASWDDRCMSLADMALEHLQAHLAGETTLSPKELVELVKTLETLHKLGRSIQGAPVDELPPLETAQFAEMSPLELAREYMNRIKKPTA